MQTSIYKILSKKNNLYILGFVLIWSLFTKNMHANPIDGVVSAGQATINSQANYTEITQQSERAVIDWGKFDIGSNEHTNFQQPSSNAVTLNRIHSDEASNINGRLTANGKLILINQNGIMFGRDAKVDVNGLLATTSNISNQRFMEEIQSKQRQLLFKQTGKRDAAIVNEGEINAAKGLVGLVAPRVVNSGIIKAKVGKVVLATGDKFTLDLYGDRLLNIAISDEKQQQLLMNSGQIIADGGEVLLTSSAGKNIVDSLIINTGLLAARHVEERDGKIIIFAEGSNAVKGNIARNKGKKQGSSKVLVRGMVDVSGINPGEKGGLVQISGDEVVLSHTLIDASGYAGKAGTTVGLGKSAKRAGSAGGEILIGGDYLGKGKVPTAERLLVDRDVVILNDAIEKGDAGRNIFWSDGVTSFHGKVFARALGGKGLGGNELSSKGSDGIDGLSELRGEDGSDSANPILGGNLGDGGFVETSGKKQLEANGYVNLLASNGETGTYFLDPSTVNIYGNFNPKFVSTDGSINLSNDLAMWIDFSDQTQVQLSYQNVLSGSTSTIVSLTAAAASGTSTLTVSSTNTTNLRAGARIKLGAAGLEYATVTETPDGQVANNTDIYTITSISGSNLMITPPLKQNYSSGTILYQGYVNQANDKSGGNNNAIAISGSNMPLWLSNKKNNLGTVTQFRGVEFLSIRNPSSSIAMDYIKNQTNFTYVIGMNLTYDPNGGWGNLFCIGDSTVGYTFKFILYRPYSVDSVQLYNNTANYISTGNGTLTTNNNSHITVLSNNYTTKQAGLYVEGSLLGTLKSWAYTIKDIAPNVHFLGTRNLEGTGSITMFGECFNGDIYEAIEYKAFLVDSVRKLIEQYQSAKWNIALASAAVPSSNYAAGINGVSNFTSEYLKNLSATADITILADNVNLDLQNDTLNIANEKNLSITARNSFNVLSNGIINTTRTISKGNISFTLSSGNLDLSKLNLNANNGGTINLTNTDGYVKLGNLNAGKIYVESGYYGDIIVPNGKTITATGAGTAITLNSGRNFKNYTTNNPLILTNNPARWLMYTCHPLANVGIVADSGNTNFSSSTYNSNFNYYYMAGVEPADNLNYMLYKAKDVNRILTLTPNIPANLSYSLEYGTAFNVPFFDYSVSGYLDNDQSSDQIYQKLLYTMNYVQGNNFGNYNIYINIDEVSSKLGYYVQLNPSISPILNKINVYQRALTVTPKVNQSKIYSNNPNTDPVFTYDLTSGSMYGSDTLSGTLSREAGESANFYKITLGTLNNPNYNINVNNNTNLFQITKKPLTVSLVAPITKTYDGTTTATLTSANYGSLVGVISGDVVNLNWVNQGLYDNKNYTATATKTVTVTGLTVDNPNYSVSSTVSTANVGIINKKSLTAVLTGSVTRTYNKIVALSNDTGTTTGLLSASNYLLVSTSNYLLPGVVSPDVVSLATTVPTGGNYDTANVGNNKLVTSATGLTLTGTDNGNYALSSTSASGNIGNITPKVLTTALTGTVTKGYNSNTIATLALANYTNVNTSTGVVAAAAGVISGDAVNLTAYANGTYENKNIGTGKKVTVNVGISNANYTIGTLLANIGTINNPTNATLNPITLTPSLNNNISKVYDGTTSVSLTNNYNLAGLVTYNSVTDDVVLNAGSISYFDKTAVTGKTITATGLTISGNDSINYTLATTSISNNTGIITKAPALTPVLNDNITKEYDGTNVAFLVNADPSNSKNYSFTGLMAGDVVTLTANSGVYNNKTAGRNKTIEFTGLILNGADANNYNPLVSTTITSSSGIITEKTLTPTLNSVLTKVYDGTKNVNLTGKYNLNGVVSINGVADDVGLIATSEVYGTKDICDNVPISFDVSLDGADSVNYTFVSGANPPVTSTTLTGTGSIEAKQLTATVSGLTTPIVKTYDGDKTVSDLSQVNAIKNATYTLSGVVANETVILDSSGAIGEYDLASAGNRTVTISSVSLQGTDFGNYLVPTVTTAGEITQKQLTATINVNSPVISKTYNGNDVADVAGVIYDLNKIGADDVIIDKVNTSGQYADKYASVSNKQVTISGLKLEGNAKGNYTLPTSTLTTIGSITKATLVPELKPNISKVYDGTNTAFLVNADLSNNYSVNGLVPGDVVSLAAGNGSYDNKNVGDKNKAIQFNDLTINGTDADNYELSQSIISRNDASITKKSLTVSAVSQSKTYGSADPGFTYTVNQQELVGGDSAEVVTGVLIREPGEDVGSYAIMQNPQQLLSANNYEINFVGALFNIEQKIIKGTLTINLAEAINLTYGDPVPAWSNLPIVLNGYVESDSMATDVITGSPEISTDYIQGCGVGNYNVMIQPGSLSSSLNYDIIGNNYVITVNPRPITIAPNSDPAVTSKTYGDPDPALSYQVISGNIVGADNLNVSLSRVAGEEVVNSPYAINLDGVVNPNYNLTYVPGNFTINPRAVTLAADSYNKVYGNEDPAFTYKITSGNLLDYHSLSVNLTRVAGENVADSPYTINFVSN